MISRRRFLQACAVLTVSFPLDYQLARGADDAATALGSSVGGWLAIPESGPITLYIGKVELGTGVQTAVAQFAAEELDVNPSSIKIVMGDTSNSVDIGPTVGSHTIIDTNLRVRRAAATARLFILRRAVAHFNVPESQLVVADGFVRPVAEQDALSYGALLKGERLQIAVDEAVPLRRPEAWRVIGKSVPRLDLPAKIMGSHEYLQNVRLAGMLHARVVHPPGPGFTLASVDEGSVNKLPGFVKLVVKGNFVGVVCTGEFDAVMASRTLKIEWHGPTVGASNASVYDDMQRSGDAVKQLRSKGNPTQALARTKKVKRVTATYRTPFQTHGSIGPSCGLADVRKDSATVWSSTQGSFPLRPAIAGLLNLRPESVHIVWVEGAGCYGHNGADDAAAEAALLSQIVGQPVRVQWMRHDEHGWDPKGPAMEIQMQGAVDAEGKMLAWQSLTLSPTHLSRPIGVAGNLLPGILTGQAPKRLFVGGDFNARTMYEVVNEDVSIKWISAPALRPSAMRGLGAVPNTFANESFIDELAAAANADPLAFRKRHLRDARAIKVLDVVAELSDWHAVRRELSQAKAGETKHGIGVSMVQLEPEGAYVATVCRCSMDPKTLQVMVTHAYVAHDCGMVVNPDGLRNQIQGALIQTISRSLKEEVMFDPSGVKTLDWATYPIIHFSELPAVVKIELVDRPEEPPVGAGEATALTVPAAIANSIFHATGIRVRTMPFTPEGVRRSA
jgi:nicotinate dehydrogenase subunit B